MFLFIQLLIQSTLKISQVIQSITIINNIVTNEDGKKQIISKNI